VNKSSGQIGYEHRDGILTITLNRPEVLNAYTPTMGAELLDAFDRADADDEIRVVVLTGAGRGFCAGADLSGGGTRFDYSAGSNHEDPGGVLALRLFASLKPVIVAYNGVAVGIGATLGLAADLRLAADSARFGFVFTRIGLVPEGASSWFLPRIVGIAKAMEWTLTGRLFDADEALAGGLVRSVHAPADLLDAAYVLAREIAAHTAPVSVALTRQLNWRMLGADLPTTAHRLDSRAFQARGASLDAAEGVAAFLEKRPANFPDLVSRDLPDFFPWWPTQPFSPWRGEENPSRD
jgi:enoyl-CoA hydratase/carnithine racemase